MILYCSSHDDDALRSSSPLRVLAAGLGRCLRALADLTDILCDDVHIYRPVMTLHLQCDLGANLSPVHQTLHVVCPPDAGPVRLYDDVADEQAGRRGWAVWENCADQGALRIQWKPFLITLFGGKRRHLDAQVRPWDLAPLEEGREASGHGIDRNCKADALAKHRAHRDHAHNLALLIEHRSTAVALIDGSISLQQRVPQPIEPSLT
mmetsp:Transcript_96430/g.249784  ORF Transcript_96430/g.249784 Transcript_96430/m.249784 type:complete len:207 (-) Transcript_96430:453-1073(-)